MIYLKTFENKMVDDNKNKIFIIDTSGSFIHSLQRGLQTINFYLADKFTAILVDHEINAVYNDITLDELQQKISTYRGGGGMAMQDAINYIVEKKLEGRVLLFTDGVIEIDISLLPNEIAILCTDDYPRIKNENGYVPHSYPGCWVFMKNFEAYDYYYPPRDGTMENYLLNRDAKPFGI